MTHTVTKLLIKLQSTKKIRKKIKEVKKCTSQNRYLNIYFYPLIDSTDIPYLYWYNDINNLKIKKK